MKSRVTYSTKQRAFQKAMNCTLGTIDIVTPRGRSTWQGSLNDLGTTRFEEFLDRLIRQMKALQP